LHRARSLIEDYRDIWLELFKAQIMLAIKKSHNSPTDCRAAPYVSSKFSSRRREEELH
jgi:hypothetical protein